MNWNVKDILAATGGQLLYGNTNQRFDGIGINSRTINPGAFFVAIRGIQYDAHGFIPEVVSKGIKGFLIEDQSAASLNHDQWKAQGIVCVTVADTTRALGALAAFQRQRWDVPLVAITGSNGKTTTRQMTAAVMSQHYNTLTTEGNLNNEIGLPLTLFQLNPTHEAVVVELGINHFGEMDRLAAICKPSMGMITNVGPTHLEFLESVEGVARAKAELLAHIDSKGYAIFNRDDDYVTALASGISCQTAFYGISPEADIRGESIVETDEGIAFDLILPGARIPVNLKTPGLFMVSNALAAATIGHLAGVSPKKIQKGLESFKAVAGRLNVIATQRGIKIIDDTYNANPGSVLAAIRTLASVRKRARCFVVLADMLELGELADQMHQEVGVAAGKIGAVKLYACGDFAPSLLSGARSSGMAENALFLGDKEAICADLIDRLEPGDWLLVKGSRAMAMETLVKEIYNWAHTLSGG